MKSPDKIIKIIKELVNDSKELELIYYENAIYRYKTAFFYEEKGESKVKLCSKELTSYFLSIDDVITIYENKDMNIDEAIVAIKDIEVPEKAYFNFGSKAHLYLSKKIILQAISLLDILEGSFNEGKQLYRL